MVFSLLNFQPFTTVTLLNWLRKFRDLNRCPCRGRFLQFLACTLVSRTSKTSLEMHDVLLCFVRQNPRNSLCSKVRILEGFWLFSWNSSFGEVLIWNLPRLFWKTCDQQDFHPQHLMNLTKPDKKLQTNPIPKNTCKQIPHKKTWYPCKAFSIAGYTVWFVSFFCLNSSEETFEIHLCWMYMSFVERASDLMKLSLDLNLPNKSPRCWRKIFWFICVKRFVFR